MSDLTEFQKFERCTEINRSKDRVKISCRLGLWGVDSPTLQQAVDEAKGYFLQYLDDGEYSSIIGGKSVIEKLKEKISADG